MLTKIVPNAARNSPPALQLHVSYWIGGALLLLSIPLLIWQSFPANQITLSVSGFLALHSLAETFSIVVAALIFFTAYGTRAAMRSLRSVAVGCAFLGVAVFDTLHFLSYVGMPDLVSANSPHKSIWFWLYGRVAAGLALLAYVLVPESHVDRPAVFRVLFAMTLLAVAGLSLPVLVAPQAMPGMFVDGVGLTPLKIGAEWGVFAVYIATAVLIYARRKIIAHGDTSSLLLALLLMAAGELFFTMYITVNSTANLLGHVYKVVAYYFLYRALYSEVVRQPYVRIQNMLTHDELTGLHSRTAFNEELAQCIESHREGSEGCALLLFGLDRFKNVNATLGHERGDLLLRAVAGRLRQALPEDAFIARVGGDNFAVLLRQVTVEQARHVGENLLKAMDQSFEIGEDRIAVSASIGIVNYPSDGNTASLLLRHAELSMHRAKRAGRDCLAVFSQELAQEVERRARIESNLRGAVERGELVLHFQPKVALDSGAIVGWEALLRWSSPELGAVSPAEFIPVAEETALILPIGEWVLREACRQLARWQELGLDTGSMAVNLSARQFRQTNWAEVTKSILAETGVQPDKLELEVTETAIIDNADSATVILDKLRALGVRISVDDFGTGHAALRYLNTFPIDNLKIDRSFVSDIPDNPESVAIVRAIVGLARSLELRVIAEGVETQAQFQHLRGEGCDEMQGHLFSPSIPADRCAEMMRSPPRVMPANAAAVSHGGGSALGA